MLKAPVLFSPKRIPDLLDPSIKGKKKYLERHHLFPKAYLESEGIDDIKQTNQAANFSLLEWPDNLDISDQPPSKYVPLLRKRIKPDLWAEMADTHALPEGWEKMPYEEFLPARRKLMAAVIRRGFEALE